MKKDNSTLFSDGREINTVSKSMANNIMPEGTKFVYFDKKHDLEEGVEVVAKTFGGLKRGFITAVTDSGLLEVNEQAVFLINVLYRIVD